MPEEIPAASGEETLHGHGIENASGFTQSPADQEHRLIARLAKRKEWLIPNSVFESAPRVMAAIVDDANADRREQIQASRTLVMMQNANTGAQSVDVRINQAIAIEVAPEAPADVNIDIHPAWAEVVNTDSMAATIDIFEQHGLMDRYLDQVKNSAPPLPSNGNGGLN